MVIFDFLSMFVKILMIKVVAVLLLMLLQKPVPDLNITHLFSELVV